MERYELRQPDRDHVRDDGAGGQLYEFVVDYVFNEAAFSVSLWARDFKDAQQRLEAIQRGGTVAGQLYSTGEVASTRSS